MSYSKSQLDRLGDRLRREGDIAAEHRQMYDEYRMGHEPSLLEVLLLVMSVTNESPSARLKTLESTRMKLQRQTIRLSQIADIAGCRIVVPDLRAQDRTVAELLAQSPGSRLVDHRASPQHGYRAIHVICRSAAGQNVELQVRTRAQDLWANVSEAAAAHDLSIKYGGGSPQIRSLLDGLAETANNLDNEQASLLQLGTQLSAMEASEGDRVATRDLHRSLSEHTGLHAVAVEEFEQIAAELLKLVVDEDISP